MKYLVPRLTFVLMLTMILAVTLVAAQPYHNWLAPGPGPHVDSHWWDLEIDDEWRLEKALMCEIDLLGVPYPEAMDDLIDAGFTLTSTQSDGYTTLFENNRVWPFGDTEGTGIPEETNGWRAMNFRKALHRLVPKAECVALYAPLNSACEWWAPPIQSYWINPDEPAPTYDPMAAIGFLDAGGFTEDSSLGVNPYYDPFYAWSARYLRRDPVYGGPVAFEYYAIGPVEAPIGFEMAQLITTYFRKAGVTVDLVAGTWLGMVIRLINTNLYDYQFMTGVGTMSQGIAPDFMYEVTYSENLPLWNFAGMNISALDEAGLRMMSTLDLKECRRAAHDIQTLLNEYEPFMPMLLENNFIATKGPSRAYYPLGPITWPYAPGSHPGLVGVVVDQRGGAAASANVFGKMLTRGDRFDLPDPNEERNLWGASEYLDTLNPLTASSEADWQVLSLIEDSLYKRNPYTMDYMWWGAEHAPTIEAWIGPGRKQIGGNEEYDNPYNGTHYVSVGPNGIDQTLFVPNDLPTVTVKEPSAFENNACWTSPENAYTSDDAYASANAPSVTYKDYGFTEIAGENVLKVEVGIEAYGDGDDYVEVQASWNNGVNWTSLVSYTPPTSDPDTTTYLDVTDERTWTWNELNNTNFRVRIYKYTTGNDNTLYNDRIPVKVISTTPPTETVKSASAYLDSFDWTWPLNATSSDNIYANATVDGANVTYCSYGFMEIPDTKIENVEVGIESFCPDGDDYVEVQASWNNGVNWTSLVSYTPPTSDPDTTTYLDVTDERTWTWNELDDDNFSVRILKRTVGEENITYIDWLPVRVSTILPTVSIKNASAFENNICWTSPENAYTSDDAYASANAPSVTYKDYGFKKIGKEEVLKVEVGIEAYGDGDDYVAVQASWDAGTSWTSLVSHTPPQSDANTTTYLDVTDERTWTWKELGKNDFRVRIYKYTTDNDNTLYNDRIPVRVSSGDDYWMPIEDVTEDDLLGDDQLGMVTTWKIREGMYWHDSDPGPNGKFEGIGDPDYDDGVKYEVTADDMIFSLNLLRDQENDMYQTQWYFVYAVEKVDRYTVKVCEERRYLFAFEGHNDVALLTPEHIWAPFIGPAYDIGAFEITLPDGTTSYGDEITAWTNHHEDWEGWEEAYIQDPSIRDPDTGAISTDPRFMLTKLIGCGPFKYHLGGWEVGSGSHVEANRQYFAHGICIGDVNFDGVVDSRDQQAVMSSGGEYGVDPYYNIRADICYPAQRIDGTEVYAVTFNHWGHYWGPPPVPPGFVYCDCSTDG